MNKQVRSGSLRPRSYDSVDNSIELVWSTGAAVRRRDYRTDSIFDEVLSLAPNHVRLDRLNAGAPLLDTHDDSNLASVLGSVVPGSAKVADGLGIARVRLSEAPGDADIVSKIRDGIIRNISVGYRIHQSIVSVGDDGDTEVRTAIDWEPLEISAVPVPADAGSQIRSGSDDTMSQSGLRRATAEEMSAMGRIFWAIPMEFWPMVEGN
ncbi:HK97 family phage prohead protease [Devosia sp. WQ 349]|uniref:HK97 family phage prohead protease n=1 Tax=Devosia sp. WQ 349K1 TaxID=2800329 RepID=UPI001908AE96|nr:HK97 family phage prohead protease [Devosia sp. WQ 349K1]MBK1793540.1 HK97 family phage prohead protease [Devosia sp. WQ 349K1]